MTAALTFMRLRRIATGLVALMLASIPACLPWPTRVAASEAPAALAALHAIDFCTEGCARVAFVDTLVRQTERLPFDTSAPQPVVELLPAPLLARASSTHLRLAPADTTDLRELPTRTDTVIVHLRRLPPAGDSLIYGISVDGRPFARNYIAIVTVKRRRGEWIARQPHYVVE